VAFYVLGLFLAALSGIGLMYFLARTWIFIPLFSAFAVVPAVFNIVTPGSELFALKIFGFPLAVTREGLILAARFVLRVAASVSFVVLLALSTKHDELLKALRSFGIPQIFVMTLGMAYRYIYMFAEIIGQTHTAIKSRVGSGIGHKKGRKLVAWSMANLWIRSYSMSSQVFSAMISRGYAGEPRTMQEFKTRPADWIFLAVAAMSLLLVLYKNYGN